MKPEIGTGLLYRTELHQWHLFFYRADKGAKNCPEKCLKILKHNIEDRGIEANSPKDAVKEAARIGLIDNPQLWIDAINARNLSVHDYFSLDEKDFVSVINSFAMDLKTVRDRPEKLKVK